MATDTNQVAFAADSLDGLGVDIVHIPTFAEQQRAPGTRFLSVFSSTEMRAARRRAGQTGAGIAHHLAARWAGKEAFIKAWSSTLIGQAPAIAPDAVPYADIQILSDAYGRPYLFLTGTIATAFGTGRNAVVSLSHDGDYAIAVCHIKGES